jgi:hypothetical protein
MIKNTCTIHSFSFLLSINSFFISGAIKRRLNFGESLKK